MSNTQDELREAGFVQALEHSEDNRVTGKTVTALDVFQISTATVFNYRRQAHDAVNGYVTDISENAPDGYSNDQILDVDAIHAFVADKIDNHGYSIHYAGISDMGLYITLTRSR